MRALVFLASLLSVELGLSAAIIEITLGVIGGNFLGLQQLDWVKYIAAFGGILLTFMAGAEVDLKVLRNKAAELTGIALSTTSLAVVYAVLVESGLAKTEIGKIIMASTFITDFGTAAGLSLLFLSPSTNTLWFVLVSVAVIASAPWAAPWFYRRYGDRVIEPELKLLFLVLFVLMYFAHLGMSHAILPAFILGLVVSPLFHSNRKLQHKLRVVAFAFVTPVFFVNGGLNISLPLLWSNMGLFLLLLAVKLATKFVGVYPVSKLFIPREAMYTTLLMSTGLTMGTISSLFGYQAGIINQSQFSVLVATVVASAIVPTFIAQRYFHLHHALEAEGDEVEPELVEVAD